MVLPVSKSVRSGQVWCNAGSAVRWRFTLAVGVGYLKREFAALGVDFEQRAELFDEALDVIRAIWTTDDVSFEGKHFSARGITAHPRPVSDPHPPIWIGGNTGAARRRVAQKGDGWCPFAAPAALAQTARTASIDSMEGLADGIDDLRRRVDEAGRDWSKFDVVFSNFDGGNPADDDFNADAYLAGLEKLAELGVTWLQVGLPGDSLAHARHHRTVQDPGDRRELRPGAPPRRLYKIR